MLVQHYCWVRILVVDDDPAIGRALERALKFEGHDITVVTTGAQAIAESIKPDAYDLVILDLGLPDVDGLDVARTIRTTGNDVGVLVLTARTELGDRVAGLDAGADDYLAKPFALEELMARVRALGRRAAKTAEAAASNGEVLQVADLRVEPDAFRVFRAEREIRLTRTEFELLEVLIRNHDIVVTRDRLLERVWGWASDTMSNSLDVYVGYLRRKLEAEGEPRLVHTIRGVGYVLREKP